MIDTERRIVLAVGPSETHGGAHTCIYHRDFPENWAQGETKIEAARNLANLFEKNLDSVCDPLHREAIERALSEVRDYLQEPGIEVHEGT